MEAIEALKLPKPDADKNTKQRGGGGASRRTKGEIKLSPSQLLTTIDLSGFAVKKISRSGIKELLDSFEFMPCIRALKLSNNGITDDYAAEILSIFDCHKIRVLDLSNNCLEKLGGMIGKKLRDEV